MSAPIITQDILKGLLRYEPETGDFTWLARDGRNAWNARYAGKTAGFDWKVGKVTYRSIRIFDWPHLAHRLAWLYVTGSIPDLIDHRDLNGLNNRWSNLRAATRSQNSFNTRLMSTNTSGFKGVSEDPSGRFRANIVVGRRQRWLGYFDTAEEAHEAYKKAAMSMAGEFARPS